MTFYIEFSDDAKEDIVFFQKAGDKSILTKIKMLILTIQESPFSGIGKPELLKHQFSGLWSRRINREHRMIYKVDKELITILSLKGHY
jgi:toxin YoeB